MNYKDKEWLHQKYCVEGLSTKEIADLVGVRSATTIKNWLHKSGIQSHPQYNPRNSKRSHPRGMLGKHHSPDTKILMSIKRRGSGNDNWKGGLTALTRGIRRSPEYYQWRKLILKRDKWTCIDCGSKENIEAHHIQSLLMHPELVFDISNGLALCPICHDRHTFWQKLTNGKRRNRK